MNRKKKSLASILLLLVLALCLSACGGKSGDNEGTDSTGSGDYVYEPLYEYDLSEYVEPGQYYGIETEPMEVVSVTDEEVEAEIEERLKAAATDEVILDDETGIETGDTVSIDYVGRMDGEEFEGGTGSTNLEIGAGRFIAGFEDGLIGHKRGEEVVLDLNFPDPYEVNPDFSGKPVEFTVTIKGISRSTVPEYNLDFVESVSDAKSIEEYEAQVKQELIDEKEAEAESTWENEIWTQIVEASEIKKYPDKEKQAVLDEYKDYYERLAENYGFEDDFEGFLEAMSVSQEKFDEDAESYAENVMKNELVLFAIAQKEDLLLTDQEYKDGIKDLLERSGFDSDADFEAAYGSSYEEYVGKDNITVSLTMNKVWEKIKENLVIVDKPADKGSEDDSSNAAESEEDGE